MSVPIDIDEYSKLIVLNEDELLERNVSAKIIDRLKRLRGIYDYWLRFPTKFDKDIVEFDMAMFRVGRSQAYDDVHLTQILLGKMQQTSKDFMRWKINQDLEEDLRIARRHHDMRAVAAIEKNRIANNRTNKEDDIEYNYDQIVPQKFVMTDDPTVIGIKKVAGLRDIIRKLERKYGDNNIEDANYEEVIENENGGENS